jgi:hypothetical protein
MSAFNPMTNENCWLVGDRVGCIQQRHLICFALVPIWQSQTAPSINSAAAFLSPRTGTMQLKKVLTTDAHG